jgi:hypothetical protein
MARTKTLRAADSKLASMASANFNARGKANVHCRHGAAGSTSSTRCAAVTAALLAVHDGQRFRALHENPTRVSSPHALHFTRTKPRLKSPQPMKPRTSLRMNAGSPPLVSASSRSSARPSRTARCSTVCGARGTYATRSAARSTLSRPGTCRRGDVPGRSAALSSERWPGPWSIDPARWRESRQRRTAWHVGRGSQGSTWIAPSSTETPASRAKALGVDVPRPGAVAFVQSFSGALLLHPHFHVLVPDGVFQPGNDDGFAAVPPPDDEDVEKLLLKVAKKVWALARARYPDGLPYAEDAKMALSAASVQTRLPLDDTKSASRSRRRCAFLEGFSLHADTHLHQNDRRSLERLCRYGARGPLAQDRLSGRDDGKLEYRLNKPLPGGATTLVVTPVQLLKRLVAVMAKPRIHLTRFFGVFGSAASARAQVVPGRQVTAPPPATPASVAAQLPLDLAPIPLPPPRLDWAALLRRTWGFDVFDCPCGGRRRVLAFVTSPEVANLILGPPSPRPRLQPTGPPQLSFAF